MIARLFALMLTVLCASAMAVDPDNQVAFYLRGTDEKDLLIEVSRLLLVDSDIFLVSCTHLCLSPVYCIIDRSLKKTLNSGTASWKVRFPFPSRTCGRVPSPCPSN
jgi:hypothetical protein